MADETHEPDMSEVSRELQDDPRWRRMFQRQWTCECCNQQFSGIPDLAKDSPDYWPEDQPASAVEGPSAGASFLSHDFCVVDGEHFFIRCVMLIPIIGGGGVDFGFGVWSSLSERNFKIYRDGFDTEEYEDPGPWFGWLSNSLKGYPETLSLKCQVDPVQNGARPRIELEETDHPLSLEFHNGMTFDRALELHAINGHNLKAALTD